MFTQRNSQVGIELCDQQIRAVSITNVKKQIHINATAIVDIQRDSSQDKITALRKARQLIKYKSAATIFALGHDDIMKKTMSVDATLTDDEISKYLKTQAVHIFGHAAGDIFIDYVPIESVKDSQQQIQAVAARRVQINLWKKLLIDCDFKLKAIDVNTYAIGRIMPFLNGNYDHKSCVAIASLQQRKLLFYVMHNNQSIYSITVEYPRLHTSQYNLLILPAFNRALQFFNNFKPGHLIKKIILMGNADYLQATQQCLRTHTAYDISIAAIDPKRVAGPPFDSRLFFSLGTALWKAQ